MQTGDLKSCDVSVWSDDISVPSSGSEERCLVVRNTEKQNCVQLPFHSISHHAHASAFVQVFDYPVDAWIFFAPIQRDEI